MRSTPLWAAALCALTGCTTHLTAVRPLSSEQERGLTNIVGDRTAKVGLEGRDQEAQWKDIRFAGPRVRFRQGDPPPPELPARWLPEAETSIASVKQIQVRSHGRGALQGLGIGALTGALVGLVLGQDCGHREGDSICIDRSYTVAGGTVAFALLGAFVGAVVSARTVIDFQDAPTPQMVCAEGLAPAIARGRAGIHAGPDAQTRIIAKLGSDTPVCAAKGGKGFGLLRIVLPEGTDGFVEASLVDFQDPSAMGKDPAESAPSSIPLACPPPLVPARARAGGQVHAGPDTQTKLVARFHADTPLCAARESEGFGLRRVRLPDGLEGFIRDDDLSR